MERIGRNRFLNADDHLQNFRMKSLLSSNQLNHFERYFKLEFFFLLISLPITSDFIFEPYVRLILYLILIFSLFAFENST